MGVEVHHAQAGVPDAAVVLDQGRPYFDRDAPDMVRDIEHADAVVSVGVGSDIAYKFLRRHLAKLGVSAQDDSIAVSRSEMSARIEN